MGLGLGLGCGAVLDADEETRDEGAAEVDEVAHLLRVRVRVGVKSEWWG